MANNREIEKYCQDYLNIKDFNDHCYNGCQVEGEENVKKIITGVSLSKKLIEKALEKKAEMIIVHHGFFMDAFGSPVIIQGVMRARLRMLLSNNINLLGFHLPLDAHLEIGNNISICKKLKLENIEKFNVGFVGKLKESIDFEEFLNKVNNIFQTKSYGIQAGNKNIEQIGIISGAASSDFQKAKYMGADTYLCGDLRENIVREVEEAGINFINAGHYNTEKFGIQNLGELIAKKFELEVEFVDIPNEI